jgi:hypothetical protein
MRVQSPILPKNKTKQNKKTNKTPMKHLEEVGKFPKVK